MKKAIVIGGLLGLVVSGTAYAGQSMSFGDSRFEACENAKGKVDISEYRITSTCSCFETNAGNYSCTVHTKKRK